MPYSITSLYNELDSSIHNIQTQVNAINVRRRLNGKFIRTTPVAAR